MLRFPFVTAADHCTDNDAAERKDDDDCADESHDWFSAVMMMIILCSGCGQISVVGRVQLSTAHLPFNS